jgi:hypothetical protein
MTDLHATPNSNSQHTQHTHNTQFKYRSSSCTRLCSTRALGLRGSGVICVALALRILDAVLVLNLALHIVRVLLSALLREHTNSM